MWRLIGPFCLPVWRDRLMTTWRVVVSLLLLPRAINLEVGTWKGGTIQILEAAARPYGRSTRVRLSSSGAPYFLRLGPGCDDWKVLM
uniref:Uncharacterized protein n=1 Tax=Oryza sativa subsp. japonica TaxID=39947 RepID=Q6ERS3_ORYSJ|nr:hypothetical protein [Oryza sativa Japonica Group]